MTPNELRDRLYNADLYFQMGVREERWDLMADAIRLRCRIFGEHGDPAYATWRMDVSRPRKDAP